MNKKLEKKDLSGLTVLKSFLCVCVCVCVCEKWSVIFVISKFFCQPMFSNDQQLLTSIHYFATLLTPHMLITAFLHFWHEGHWEPCNDVGSLSPAKLLMGFELGMFWFWLQCLNLLGHSPQKIYIIYKAISRLSWRDFLEI